ncbi:MAG: aldehyde dehydrogenase family protein [Clostridiales Family XIII bacterium]|jgi:betaine-aldehyde dehydrogenase|nr:aldehyde dehydrogenase family protein [Clostridiales Family XIII bacterium]
MEVLHVRNYIDGVWRDSLAGKKKELINPADGSLAGTHTDSGSEDAALAIAAAKRAFHEDRAWPCMNVEERSDTLLKIASLLEARSDEIARVESINNGKPLREAEADVWDAVHCFRYFAGLAAIPQGGSYQVPDGFGKMRSFAVHEPVGVCGLITPWNYPLLMGVWKIAPALAAGNCIVYKPSSNTPLSSKILFEILAEAGLPPGAANMVIGPGGSVGKEIAENPDVDMVSFTGSTATGQDISRRAAGNLKRVSLELGGKSPNVIFADADLEGAVEWAMIGIFFNQGEVCSAGSRIIIESSFKDKFLARLAERANALTIGNPLDNPDMGPLITKAHMEKVLKYIESGKAEGAKCVCGGYRHTEGGCGKGFYVAPTIFDGCTRDMRIVKEEIFGPVVTVQTFETEEEAIRMANDTDYGLAGAVFTKDGARALRVVERIRAGITWINCYNPTFNGAPWGGYKKSGVGRELGLKGFEEYQEIKQVNILLNPGPVGWYN